ncbi:MAG: GNAT family N-acetyltransferase [Chloroflexi bacterium]|nr:GNAT family N-acetyltransferase [Chloroflexota bacterium]
MEILQVEKEVVKDFLDREWEPFDLEQFGGHTQEIWAEQTYSLAAYQGEVVVGAAVFQIEGGVGKLEELIVGTDYRQRGVGGQLIDRFEEICRQEGCHKLRLITLLGSPAQPFYENHGYHQEAVSRRDFQGRDWAVMVKFIAHAPSPPEGEG